MQYKMKCIDLDFGAKLSIDESVPIVIDGHQLLDKLTENNFEKIRINWCDLFVDELFVEDDVLVLVDAYNELADFDDSGTQNIYLGDGSLQVDATVYGGNVEMVVKYTPYLDKRFSEQKEVVLTKKDYCQSWRNIIGELMLSVYQ